MIIARNRKRTAYIVVDFEHQSLMTESNGQPAPAAGWIDPQSLTWEPSAAEPGLYGAVTWTMKAKAMIDADEYRYLSPVFPYDSETGEPLDIISVALTNTPAINEEQAAAAAALATRGYFNHPEEDHSMDLKQLLAALGLPENTSEADAMAAVAALKTKADEAETQIAALTAKAQGNPDPAKFVPVAVVNDMRTQLAALTSQVNTDQVGRLVDQAIADGKLLEPQRQWATEYGNADIAGLRQYIQDSPVIAAARGGTQTDGENPAGKGGNGTQLNDSELAVCKALGLTPDEFAKGKQQEA